MATFPTLASGAVMQYPASRTLQYSTQVVRFLDGTEQRFEDFAQPLHRWVINLDLLTETEIASLRQFFRTQQGGGNTFCFTDPWDGTQYQNCTLESDVMTEQFLGEMRGNTSITVRENRS
jgi:hypothetical protein